MQALFARLEKLVNITYEGETAEEKARWLENCKVSGVADNGYAVVEKEDGDFDTAEFDYSELECDSDVTVFDFAGERGLKHERFYIRECDVYKHKQTGVYYTEYTEELDSF